MICTGASYVVKKGLLNLANGTHSKFKIKPDAYSKKKKKNGYWVNLFHSKKPFLNSKEIFITKTFFTLNINNSKYPK